MNFPQFGDAGIYSEIGAACASPLTSAQGSAFSSCYSPIRPVGMVALTTLPFLVSRDPVEVAYVARPDPEPRPVRGRRAPEAMNDSNRAGGVLGMNTRLQVEHARQRKRSSPARIDRWVAPSPA